MKSFVSALLSILCCLGPATGTESLTSPDADRPPNVVLIMVDDLGWMDLALQGNEAVQTPHLDQLAREGLRFTDAYAAAPVCSPTRAALITGWAPARLQITNHLPDRPRFTPDKPKLLPAKTLDRLPREHVTLSERLKEAGYATAFLGKWHLSGPGDGLPAFEPTAQGFDINLGGCSFGGPPTFFDPYHIPNLPDRKAGEYLPDRLADESLTFMQAKRDQPFFLCLWPYTVHWPMEAPVSFLKKYAKHEGPGMNDPRYGAMIEAMDAAMGRVLAGIDQLGLRDDTLVIFTSDNGGFSGVADNRPLRDGKGDLYEGGLRVPLLIRWPGKIAPGKVSDTPVITMDLYPTILQACGLSPKKEVDGQSLLPLFAGDAPQAERPLFFHYPNYAWHRSNRLGGAIRLGPYKLIERFDDGSLELFNLKEDLSETRNLAAAQPHRAAELHRRLATWRQAVRAPMPQPVPN
jgi:arylsulfatase A-like enzyme